MFQNSIIQNYFKIQNWKFKIELSQFPAVLREYSDEMKK